MNKTESIETLKRRLDDAERKLADQALELAVLRKTIEAPEPVEKKPLVQAQRLRGCSVLHSNDGYVSSDMTYFANGFATKSQAQAYAEAFNTLLDLHRQPGSEPAEGGKQQWVIRGNGRVDWFFAQEVKREMICPPFDSEASARAALEAVGWDRIKRMYDTLHGRIE